MKKRRAFTIIELVIVIGVIGILSSILIPTFVNLTNKAHYAKDVATVTNINKVYSADKANKSINRYNTMYQALNEISDNSFNLETIQKNSSGGHFIAWDRINDRFVLVNESDDTFKDGDKEVHIDNKYDFFRVYDEIPSQQDYSIYLTNKNVIGSIDDLQVGLDCGDNKSITNLIYDRRSESTKRDIYIRTSKGTHAEIHGYDDGSGVGDEIYHYGEASEIIEDSASGSFYECGASAYTVVNKGHYVQNSGTIVSYLEVKASDGDVVIDFKNGTKQGMFKNTNTTNSVEVNGEHNVEIVNLDLDISNGPISVDLETQPIYTNQVDSSGTNSNSFNYSLNGIGDAISLPPSSSSCTEHHFISVPGYSVRICETCCHFEYEEEIVERNDQINEPRVESYAYTPTTEGLEKSNISEDHVHEYGEPDWYWLSESVVTAKFVCSSDDCDKSISYTIDYDDPSEDAYIEYVVESKEDCTHIGTYRCIAHLNMNDHNYESEREGYKEVPALGHQIVTHEAKTATCEEYGWNEYETCSREGCDHSTYEENIIKATGHEGNPCVHCGQVFISVRFANTDKYIYRAGNSNAVQASWLFSMIPDDFNEDNVDIDNVKGQANGSYNSTDQSFTFTNTGIVSISYKEEVLLTLEIVDGTNIFSYSQFPSSGNIVFMNDIIMSNGGTKYLSSCTLFGNGFLFDVTHAATTHSKPMTSNNYVICLNNSTLDNVRIQGAIYSSYGIQVKDDYNFPTVLFGGGNCSVINSYISNCASPIRAAYNGKYLIKNTTLCGGSYCNLDVQTNSPLTLDNITTINQTNGNDEGSKLGLGIVVYYDGEVNPTINVVNGIHQYNYLKSNETSNCVSFAQSFASKLFDIVDSKFIYNDNDVQIVNAGILSMNNSFQTTNLSNISGYAWNSSSLSFSGYIGKLYTKLASTPETPNAYQPMEQGVIEPKFTINLSNDDSNPNYVSQDNEEYCYYESTENAVRIRIRKNSSFEYNPNVVSITKYGQELDYTVTMNDVNYSGQNITFDTEGEYTIRYIYSDNLNIDLQGNEIEPMQYSKELHVSVSYVIEAKKTEFIFDCHNSGAKTEIINGVNYVMPDVSSESSDIVSKTIGGKTVFCPKIKSLYSTSQSGTPNTWSGSVSGSNMFLWYKIYDSIITIRDYDSSNTKYEYNSSTTTLSLKEGSGLSLVDNTVSKSDTREAFRWFGKDSDISNSTFDPVTKNSKLYFRSIDASSNARSATTFYIHYQFKSINGDTCRYVVAYETPEKTKSGGCFTPETLITLSDGTKKPIKDISPTDTIKSYNFLTGEFEDTGLCILVNHGYDYYKVLNLLFDDGTHLGIIADHGLFDYDENKFVYLEIDSVDNYVGHRFFKQDENGSKLVTLTEYYIEERWTEAYSLTSAYNMNALASDLLSVAPPGDFYNWISMSEKMRYDIEALNDDIATYGLYDYSVFAPYGISYETYLKFNGAYLKIPVSKGYFTFEYILELIDLYDEYFV